MAERARRRMPPDPDDRRFPAYPGTDEASAELGAEQADERNVRQRADELGGVDAREEAGADGEMAPDELEVPLPSGESRDVPVRGFGDERRDGEGERPTLIQQALGTDTPYDDEDVDWDESTEQL